MPLLGHRVQSQRSLYKKVHMHERSQFSTHTQGVNASERALSDTTRSQDQTSWKKKLKRPFRTFIISICCNKNGRNTKHSSSSEI